MSDTHEVRELKWKLKTLSKQSGRQGDTIHHLRGELAELREINGRIAITAIRDADRRVISQAEEIASLREQVERLREKLAGVDADVETTVEIIEV